MAGSASQQTTLDSPALSRRSQKSVNGDEVVSTAKKARVHVITGKGALREIKVRKAGSGKSKVQMETLKYPVVRGPTVRRK